MYYTPETQLGSLEIKLMGIHVKYNCLLNLDHVFTYTTTTSQEHVLNIGAQYIAVIGSLVVQGLPKERGGVHSILIARTKREKYHSIIYLLTITPQQRLQLRI